ncbi:NAD(P)-binding protein [Favolaschia claudopus]|uniref:NAD(P)-binding protein n=1 Tax=Favolaschia claudopus TaxID=2862362 RepID=A0AAW0A7D7_9AGAR
MTISTSPTAPLVVIIGITGKQGGSVVRALIESPKPYRIRGLTRNKEKPAAVEYTRLGVQMVAVAVTVGNEENVKKAFDGGEIIFEVAEGKLMIDTALQTGTVSLFIWSALESFGTLSSGRIPNVKFFDSKAIITEYARASGIPLAIVQAGYYASNILDICAMGSALRPQDDGSFVFSLPMKGSTLLPVIDVERDYGLYVRAVIEEPGFGAGCEVLSGRLTSMEDMIAGLGEATGKKITYRQITREEFVNVFPFKAMAIPLADMYQAYEQIGYYGKKPVTDENILARKIRSWGEFLEATPDLAHFVTSKH